MSVRYLVPLLAVLCCSSVSCSGTRGVTLQGSGATFPAPLYKRWFLEYYKKNPDVRVSYQAIGSGAGERQFRENLVQFAASDSGLDSVPDKRLLDTREFDGRVGEGVQLLPLTAGLIVLAYNLEGAPSEGLKLTREAYAGIFLDEIRFWNDDAIQSTNPGVKLPKQRITVVRRAEGSGTTFAFTNHLNRISPKWTGKQGGPGVGKTVVWPRNLLGARGNSGVAAMVQQTPGAIGYLEYEYANLSKLPVALLQNKSGTFVRPSASSGQAALAGVEIPDSLRLFIPDPPGQEAYPIVTYTWILCHRKYRDPKVAETLKKVFEYSLRGEGQKIAGELGYLPLPERVVTQVRAALQKIGS